MQCRKRRTTLAPGVDQWSEQRGLACTGDTNGDTEPPARAEAIDDPALRCAVVSAEVEATPRDSARDGV